MKAAARWPELLLVVTVAAVPVTGEVEMPEAVAVMLSELESAAERPFAAEAGRAVWFRDREGRSCPSCHTDSVLARGRHERTGKVIEPMARSVNPERLTERKKIDKWFKRNCKWTVGRECTAQEKGDILVWLVAQ